MHTPEEVRRATQALVKEAEQLSAQSRQQRMLLRCLSVNLLKLHARLKHQGKSVSLHGQGLTREWRSFTITIERERTA